MLYERITDLCKEKGISVASLEREVGMSRGSLCKIDTHKPNVEKMEKIADCLGTTIDYILKGTKEKEAEKYYFNSETERIAQQIFESNEMRVLFDVARDASPEDIQTVYMMLLALKRKEKGN